MVNKSITNPNPVYNNIHTRGNTIFKMTKILLAALLLCITLTLLLLLFIFIHSECIVLIFVMLQILHFCNKTL
jgi:hypothetical protein